MEDALTELVALRRAEGAGAELEVRAGTAGEGGEALCAGIDAEGFAQLHQELSATAALTAESEWRQVVDYHYVGLDGAHVRTRVECDVQGFTTATEHVTKTVLLDALLHVEDGADACRVSCARETPLATPPKACLPTHVRIKHRRRFFDVRDGHVVWSYELSRVWSGATRAVAEEKQRTEAPVCEVECELVDAANAYLNAHDDAFVARSLALKASALLGTQRALVLGRVRGREHGRKRNRASR